MQNNQIKDIENILDKFWNHNECVPVIAKTKKGIEFLGYAATPRVAEVVGLQSKITCDKISTVYLKKDNRKFFVLT